MLGKTYDKGHRVIINLFAEVLKVGITIINTPSIMGPRVVGSPYAPVLIVQRVILILFLI